MLVLSAIGGLASAPALANCTAIAAECRSVELERRLLLDLIDAARRIEDPWQRFFLIAKIAKAAFLAGEMPVSRELFAEAADLARQPADPFERMLRLMDLASAHRDVGDLAAARTLFSDAAAVAASDPDAIGRDAARQRLAAGMAEAGQIAEALAVARDIEQPYYRAPTLSAIANAYAGAGDTASAFALFKEALADIPAIPVAGGLRLARHVDVLRDLAAVRALAGDLEGARKTIALMPSQSRDWTLRLVVRALMQRVDIENALLIAHDIGPAQRNHAQRDIVQALVTAGEIVKAIATSDALFPPGTIDHGESAVIIAIAQAGAGHPEEARDTAAEILLNVKGPDRLPEGGDPASLWNGPALSAGPDDGPGSLLGAIWSAEGEDADAGRRDSVLVAIAKAEAEAGKLEQAFSTLDGILNPQQRTAGLIGVNIAIGQPQEALAVALSVDVSNRYQALAQLLDALISHEGGMPQSPPQP
jgi:tetratricopeptide (TPR) repeat protein